MAEGLGHVLAKLRQVPERVSVGAIKRLAANCMFQVFEDATETGKRVSLGGTIIVVDLDLDQDGVITAASLSLASESEPSNESHSFSSSKAVPSPHTVLLESLQRPGLDRFGHILSFLGITDRLSTPPGDCFRAIDEISDCLFRIHSKSVSLDPHAQEYLFPYGRPILNPSHCLGLGIEYLPNHLVVWAVQELKNPDHKLVYSKDWIDNIGDTSVDWNDPAPQADARAQFVLKLEPPVSVTQQVAERLCPGYFVTDTADIMVKTVARTVKMPDGSTKPIDFTLASLLQYAPVVFSELPIVHPRQLPVILDALRNSVLVYSRVWSSVYSLPAKPDTNLEDISYADLVMLQENNKQPSETLLVSASLEESGEGGFQIHLEMPEQSLNIGTEKGVLRVDGGDVELLSKIVSIVPDLGILVAAFTN